MSNRPRSPIGSMKWLVLVGVFFLTFFFGLYFLIIFTPLVTYFLWEDRSRIRALEKRLADKESQGEVVVTEGNPVPATSDQGASKVSTEK